MSSSPSNLTAPAAVPKLGRQARAEMKNQVARFDRVLGMPGPPALILTASPGYGHCGARQGGDQPSREVLTKLEAETPPQDFFVTMPTRNSKITAPTTEPMKPAPWPARYS